MNQTLGSSGFARGKDFTRSSLGLKNGGEMIFILPDQGVSPYDLLSSPEEIERSFEEGEDAYGEVVWKIPSLALIQSLSLRIT